MFWKIENFLQPMCEGPFANSTFNLPKIGIEVRQIKLVLSMEKILKIFSIFINSHRGISLSHKTIYRTPIPSTSKKQIIRMISRNPKGQKMT